MYEREIRRALDRLELGDLEALERFVVDLRSRNLIRPAAEEEWRSRVRAAVASRRNRRAAFRQLRVR